MLPCLLFMFSYPHAIYHRASPPDHTVYSPMHSDYITWAVNGNVWRPPLGHKMQGRLVCDATLWSTGPCPLKIKKRAKRWENNTWWVRRCRIKLLTFLHFSGAIRDLSLWIHARTLADMEKHCTGVSLSLIINVKRPVIALLMDFWPLSVFFYPRAKPWCCCRSFCILIFQFCHEFKNNILNNSLLDSGGLCGPSFLLHLLNSPKGKRNVKLV